MTIQSKIKRIVEHPIGAFDYLCGVCPKHTLTIDIAETILRKKIKMLIDVGANRGDFIKAVKWVGGKDVKYYAFEPVPNIYNYVHYNFGLSNNSRITKLYRNKINPAWSTLHKPIMGHHPDFQDITKFNEIKVKLRRFDELKLKIERPCFLKIDVEGHEYEVLEGFGDRLNEVDFIQVEHIFRNYFSKQINFSRIVTLLEKYKFNGIQQVNLINVGGILSFCDFLFFRVDECL